jgi:DNA primase
MTERFEALAENNLTPVVRGPKEWMCACPFCDSETALQFNIEKGLFTCFRCGEGGNAKKLLKKLGKNYTDPAVSVQFLQDAMSRLKLKNKHKHDEPTILDENYLLRFGGPLHEYWDNRRFTAATAREWGLGYDPISDRCTIAYRNPDGDLLGVIYRRLDDQFPRYIYPKGFNRTSSLFGSWKISAGTNTRVVLSEGATDCLRITQAGFDALAQFGSSTHRSQAKLLAQLGITQITCFFDYDEAGKKAEEKAQEILQEFILKKVIWDTTKYCWHKKLCSCGNHTWRTIADCKKKVLCRCNRRHEMDPGKLSDKEIASMIKHAVLMGGKKDGRQESANRSKRYNNTSNRRGRRITRPTKN